MEDDLPFGNPEIFRQKAIEACRQDIAISSKFI